MDFIQIVQVSRGPSNYTKQSAQQSQSVSVRLSGLDYSPASIFWHNSLGLPAGKIIYFTRSLCSFTKTLKGIFTSGCNNVTAARLCRNERLKRGTNQRLLRYFLWNQYMKPRIIPDEEPVDVSWAPRWLCGSNNKCFELRPTPFISLNASLSMKENEPPFCCCRRKFNLSVSSPVGGSDSNQVGDVSSWWVTTGCESGGFTYG